MTETDLTIIIVAFKSEENIEECLKSEGSVTKKILTKLQDRSLWANA